MCKDKKNRRDNITQNKVYFTEIQLYKNILLFNMYPSESRLPGGQKNDGIGPKIRMEKPLIKACFSIKRIKKILKKTCASKCLPIYLQADACTIIQYGVKKRCIPGYSRPYKERDHQYDRCPTLKRKLNCREF